MSVRFADVAAAPVTHSQTVDAINGSMPQVQVQQIDSHVDGEPVILETEEERRHFTESLRGKKVLHVKGFGSSFKDPTSEQQGIDDHQRAAALIAMQNFAPDYFVVDGDPWGKGFQTHLKDYIDEIKGDGQVPTLIWAKNVELVDHDRHFNGAEAKQKRLKQAKEWAQQGLNVVVFWVDAQMLDRRIDEMFGDSFVEDHRCMSHDVRGLRKIVPEPQPTWVKGMSDIVWESILAIESADRGAKRYFEKCSFENAAKGNLIFDLLHIGKPAQHGVVCFGGGESVLLEIATKYLNKSSEALQQDIAVFPFTRGREGQDPVLPSYRGASFSSGPSSSIADLEVVALSIQDGPTDEDRYRLAEIRAGLAHGLMSPATVWQFREELDRMKDEGQKEPTNEITRCDNVPESKLDADEESHATSDGDKMDPVAQLPADEKDLEAIWDADKVVPEAKLDADEKPQATSGGDKMELEAQLAADDKDLQAEPDADKMVPEAKPDADKVEPEVARVHIWQQFQYPTEHGLAYWWWREATAEHEEDSFFVKNDVGMRGTTVLWQRYAAPQSNRRFWWRSDDCWFFEDTGAPC